MEGIRAEINIEGMDELTSLINEAMEGLMQLSETLERVEAAKMRVNLKMKEAAAESGL